MNWQGVFSEMLEQKAPSGGSGSMYVYARIVELLRVAIEDGRLKIGDRLPTNRELAAYLKVDRSTVARAYLELVQLNLIASQVGRGTFVSAGSTSKANNLSNSSNSLKSSNSFGLSSSSNAGPGELNWPGRFSRYADGLNSSINKLPQLASGDDFISFAGGIPSQDSYPSDDFQKIVLDLLGGGRGASMFDYSPFAGEPDLRQAVTSHLSLRGITLSDQELLILSGSQQGIDLVANLLINPGDYVLVEEPTYFWAISNFKARQAQLVGCPLDSEGIDLVAVEAHLIRYQPKFIYVMPNSQNPTGITMSLARRRGLLALALKYQTPILEDDFAGDLVYGVTALPSLRTSAAEFSGGKNLVIYQGTFSKALCPGIRLGWLVGPQEVIDRLSFAKRTSDLATNSMVQVILTEFLQKGLYQEHLSKVNRIYGKRRDAILAALSAEFSALPGVSWTVPTGGLFIWLTLPKNTSNRDLLEFAVAEKVVFSPGDICFVDADENSQNYIRLCFIQNAEPRIADGIKRLARALSKYLSHLAKERLAQSTVHRRNEHVLI